MEGRVFDIQQFCTHDGPGIRTTVFLKGCPLRCAWCHNPESQRPGDELLLHTARCIGCGRCREVCPHGDAHATLRDDALRRDRCNGCGGCADACPAGAIERVGGRVTVGEVMERVLRDEAYYRHSGGGMTLSGGEPLAQPAFAKALLTAARDAGIHTAVETSGQGRAEDLQALLPVTDLLLWDIKSLDEERYLSYTGLPLEPMLRNLRAAYDAGAGIVLRAIYIPELHGGEESDAHATALAGLLDLLPGVAVEHLPYHPMGNSKREKLGLSCEGHVFRTPEPGEVARLRECIERLLRVKR